ncbi:MAG TPA: 3'-5' exonuclease [Candidatus Limiplasma sp.]|nr:3'-5' exonuclease [Candidatus Limiplasma sp.]HRX08115.1 3'-5' exonuclease [Candidatus Limiplasma sp.]
MNNRYIVFDVETPNAANNRMSALGITVVDNGAITDEWYSLVDPQVRFDVFNVKLTGITPEMVRDQPTFQELWGQIRPLFDSGILVAHYAPFDMGVLKSCLNAYGIVWKPYVNFACTCAMGRVCYPKLPNHRLNTLSEHVGITLDHHHADSDSRAAALLLLDYMEKGLSMERFIRRQYL